MRHRLISWLAFMLKLYGFGVGGYLAARAALPQVRDEHSRLVTFINSFLHLLLLPAALLTPLLPIFALVGRAGVALGLIGPAGYFWRRYGPMLSPKRGPKNPSEDAFTFLTFNTHGEDKFLSPMLNILRTANADVVGLQEVSFALAARIRTELAELYPHQALHPNGYGSAGQAILSRFPILEDRYWRNLNIPNFLAHQRAVLTVNGKRLVFYNTHPVHPAMVDKALDAVPRGWEVRDVLHRAAAEYDPVIIAGDMNLTDQTDDYRAITALFGDVYREVGQGMGYSFPDWREEHARSVMGGKYLYWMPLFMRLDFIFHSAHIRPLAAQVWDHSGGSDHRPVFARLSIE